MIYILLSKKTNKQTKALKFVYVAVSYSALNLEAEFNSGLTVLYFL